jgi:hypothetical protein
MRSILVISALYLAKLINRAGCTLKVRAHVYSIYFVRRLLHLLDFKANVFESCHYQGYARSGLWMGLRSMSTATCTTFGVWFARQLRVGKVSMDLICAALTFFVLISDTAILPPTIRLSVNSFLSTAWICLLFCERLSIQINPKLLL